LDTLHNFNQRFLLRFALCCNDANKKQFFRRLHQPASQMMPAKNSISKSFAPSFWVGHREFISVGLMVCGYLRQPIEQGSLRVNIAIAIIDASEELNLKILREIQLAYLMGADYFIFAVNELHIGHLKESKFKKVSEKYRAFAQKMGAETIHFIPVSILHDDNILHASKKIPWYQGPTLLKHLNNYSLRDNDYSKKPLRILIKKDIQVKVEACEADNPSETYFGFIASGILNKGDVVQIQPRGKKNVVTRVFLLNNEVKTATAGQNISFALQESIEIYTGDIISSIDAAAEVADHFEATLIWLSDESLLPGRQYGLKICEQTVTATVTNIKYEVNTNNLEHLPATNLRFNSISCCNIKTSKHIPFDNFKDNNWTGFFTLLHQKTNDVLGAGFLRFALRRSHNIYIQNTDINKAARANLKRQQPRVIWFTGLSGSGKSTIANTVEKKLHQLGMHTYILDGDNIRHGLNKDLGFSDEDRVENIRRIAEVARLMTDAGLIVLTAFISPFRSERQMARELFSDGEFIEVFVDTPIELAEERDPKGLYKKARNGELKNFTGIDSPYEKPDNPEITLKTSQNSAEELAIQLCNFLQNTQ